MSTVSAIKRGWTRFAHTLGAFNTRVILTLVYWTLFGLGRLFLFVSRQDPLNRRTAPGASLWAQLQPPSETDPIAAHRRQF